MSQCQNPICQRSIESVPGHRRRKYCDDACKQTAYRLRLEAAEQERIEAERQEYERQELEALRTRYREVLPDTLRFLYELRKQGQYRLVEQIGHVILTEIEHAHQDEAEQRNQLIEEIMLLGEKIGYSAMTLGRMDNINGPGEYALMGGVDCWSSFVSNASLFMLRQTRDTAYYHAEGYKRSRERRVRHVFLRRSHWASFPLAFACLRLYPVCETGRMTMAYVAHPQCTSWNTNKAGEQDAIRKEPSSRTLRNDQSSRPSSANA
ncbi:hypothetical protein [Dictyobacter aurantiacus]|uniref:Uncharacterized protein n=1 Tax=Dictyobacter aurantiacus TaxID=1936993 RepID=A0A401ZH04_9CHLR|nr:hypothetical protein [Dictyobacter aurantiacus]GCE06147.1 hypothetical protein KDAU_34760 [Dictyobacter aurantiacus]